MELLKTEDVATVILFDLRLSEGEIQYLATAVNFVLKNLNDEQLHVAFNEEERRALETPSETRKFLESTFHELIELLQDHCRTEFLPRRFREWKCSR